MVAGTQPQPQQQQPLSAEEEAVKRNTDCVYFLASPLTCKKGSECEYRHSEYARVNPRDCWYWLNSACLNPKCPFRHPPIEGLLGTQATPPAVPATSSSQPAPAAAPAAGQSSGKPACIYFQKGYCMKGDRCQFSHGPSLTAITKVTQPLAPSSLVSDPSSVKKAFGGLQKCTQEQKLPPAAISRGSKAVTAPPPPPTRNGVSVARIPVSRDPPTMNGISTHRPSRSRHAGVSGDHGAQNGRDADEFLRESSPGFDVLVEDELGDQDYFRGSEDQYGRPRGHNGRNPNADEYGVDHLPVVAVAVPDGDRGRFRDPRGYESYDRVQGQQHAWEPRRASAERVAAEPAQYDRRGYRKSNSPDNNINGPDLRHRLSQHRRADGLRSVVSDDRKHRSSSRVERESRHPVQPHEGPLSSRLRGRINFGPDRGRSQGGSPPPPPPPPSRPQAGVSYPGRFGDRLKGRAQEEYNAEGRSFRGSRNGDFSGPKSLSELKGRKLEGHEDREQSVLGKRKSTVAAVEASQQHGGEASFEGPMSLSEILKRKRGTAGRETESIKPAASSGGDVVGSEVEKVEDGNVNGLEVEEGMIYGDNDDDDDEVVADDDQELEADDQAPGEYDYEEEEYDIENAEGEDEYLEDEDDDFAKKIGVLSS